jgi:hypothetical protein
MLHHTTEPPDLRREALLGTLGVGYVPAREALNGTQWHAEALSGALSGTQSGTQRHSVAHSEALTCKSVDSVALSGTQ